ncbi:MAG TPA: N-acetylmuramoyl-L-alanine amidase [Thermodesulfobacteriota bacterium]|nr:N-acetylmuramoyl-L-alanine amidase [Thermodesulfobacteriota bacterium]
MKNKTLSLRLYLFLPLILYIQPVYAQEKGESLYQESLKLYKDLTSDPVKINDSEIWDIIARAFYSTYLSYPDSPKAPDSLFLSGKMYEEMGNRFNSRQYYQKSIDYCREFIRRYPDSNLTDDAQIRIARVVEGWDRSAAYSEYELVVKNYPKGDMVYAARSKLEELSAYKPTGKDVTTATESKPQSARLVNISEIRHWSTENYTRVVIHVDKEMPFKPYFLKADPEMGKPPRLFVDIEGTKVDRNLRLEPIEKGLLEDIKFARNTPDQVRVVLYIKNFDEYRVFSLHDPFRIVMDIYGEKSKDDLYVREKSASGSRTPSTPPRIDYSDVSSLRGALGLKVRTIVIDPGHGGHDSGAVGPSGLKEKDVNLDIAKELKRKIEQDGKNFGVTRVVLTRSDDRFIPLEERTGIARREKADLFVSIHCNAAKNNHAYGIETYILSFTKDPEALAVAARENSTTRKSLSDLEDIVKKYLLSSKIDESNRLATHVQSSVINRVSQRYDLVNNKGVKKAPFIVLIGADIPSILVETSFITNPREEKRLKDDRYISDIVDGIFAGIKKYSNEVETAFLTE